jgi:hypothetical protein
VSESGSLSVAVALLADMLRARNRIDRNYPFDLDGLARVAGLPRRQDTRSATVLFPARPCDMETVMRDDTGNWLVLVEPREFTAEYVG